MDNYPYYPFLSAALQLAGCIEVYGDNARSAAVIYTSLCELLDHSLYE